MLHMLTRAPAGFVAPCLPITIPRPPTGPLWIREIKHDRLSPFLYAFDLLAADGEDLRREPLEIRKATLASLLRKPPTGIAL
jgi:hypothetical protein